MSNVRHVSATGNASSDTANIQGAITELTTSEAYEGPKLVILTGDHYKINEPLVAGEMGGIGDPHGNSSHLPRIVGAGMANLEWVGSETSEYLLNYLDPYARPGTYISNLCVWCDHKCRGIRVQHATYGATLEGVRIRESYQIGLDLIDCWGSVVRGVSVTNGKGLAYRTSSFGSGAMYDIYANGMDDSEWPATNDESIYNYEGSYVQTPSYDRAHIVLSGGTMCVSNIVLESNAGGRGITVSGSRIDSNAMRLEASIYSGEAILLSNAADIAIRNVSNAGTGNGPPVLVTARGDCRNIEIDHCFARDVTDAVLECYSGSHSGHSVSRCYNNVSDMMSLDRWITEGAGSPTLSGDPYCIGHDMVAIPKMEHILYV